MYEYKKWKKQSKSIFNLEIGKSVVIIKGKFNFTLADFTVF